MKISIIIPVYNVINYLVEAIESVIHQSYTAIEILLIDDGSTDGSENICDEYKKRDDRVKVIHQTNRGLSEARNIGIEHATGEYLFFLDSDDYISHDCLRKLYLCMKKFQADIVYSNHHKFQDGQKNIALQQSSSMASVMDKEEIIKQLMRVGPWADEKVIISCNKLYSRKLFEKIRFPIGRIHEDEYVAHNLYYAASCIVYLDEVTYFYRMRDGSIMNDKTFQLTHFLDSFEFGKDRMAFCHEYMPALYAQSVRAYIDNMQIQYFLNDSATVHRTIKHEITKRIFKIQPELWKSQTPKYCLKTFFFLINPKRWRKRYWG